MTKFNIGDILANYSGGLDKPAYEVVDNTDGVYRLKQIPSGTYFTWKYVIVEAYNALYIAPTPPPVTCTGGSPHHGNGGALLRHFDADNDGIISKDEWWAAEELMMHGEITEDEFSFVLAAYNAGSINAKCPGCYTPPDPCAGVTCPNGCWGTSLYSQRCVDGRCVKGALIKSNAPECGYVAPSLPKAIIEYSYTRPTSAKPLDRLLGYVKVKNIGGQANSLGDFTVKWINADTGVQFATTQNLGVIAPGSSTGNNIYINMPDIARPLRVLAKVYYKGTLHDSKESTVAYTAPPDPCAGVTCPNGCWGTSLYSKKCVDGHCVKGALIKSNAPECGYVAPSLPKAIIEYSYTRPTSAKPLDRLLGYVKVKNIGGQANSLGDFTVKWINADTGVQFATTQNLGVIAPGSSTGNNIYINMPDIARPLRVLAKVYYKGTLHDSKESTVAYTAPPAPVTPAKGQLLNVVLPTSKIHGSTAKITATIKNIGGTTRKFEITLYRVAAPGVYITQTPGYTIGPGESVNTEISWDAPTSGTSVRYSLKCVNVDDFSLDDHRNFDVALTAPFVCAEGEVRSPETCWDDTTIHGEVCRDNTWVPSGATCPPKPECTEGDKKPGHVCSGGKWVPVGTPPAPECTEGDKKPGYVCSGGKWVPVGMPGPMPHGAPSTIEAPEIIPGINPPRIPLLTPELAKIPLLPGWVIRDADGNVVAGKEADTIEFQEIIPGVTPPRIPQLIPWLEDLPLLPGWTIRNREGTIVAHGAHLPTIVEEK